MFCEVHVLPIDFEDHICMLCVLYILCFVWSTRSMFRVIKIVWVTWLVSADGFRRPRVGNVLNAAYVNVPDQLRVSGPL